MLEKRIGSIGFILLEDFDFAFLDAYGVPFVVFDQQDSGNLCFGVEKDGKRLFLKMAGAHTTRMHGTAEQAIERMRRLGKVYEDLAHPVLIPLIEHREIPGGYLQVYQWFDGVCMGKQYGSHERFLALPVPEKLDIYRHILDFHVAVVERGYTAIDFYDACLLYDFDARTVRICDIEMYQKGPVPNQVGRMPGSTRYMSPEEFTMGATVDELSNVYCMGAAAFNLLGGVMDHSYEKWTASRELFDVAVKAASQEREDRYPTLRAYAMDWDRALRA